MERVARLRAAIDVGALWRAGAVIGLGLAVGALTSLGFAHSDWALAILLLLVVPAPIVVRLLQGKFDPFEPIQIVAVTFFLLFALRPVAELVYGIDSFFGYKMRWGFSGAAAIVLAGTLAVYCGYALPTGLALARRLRPRPARWDRGRSVRFAVGILAVATFLTAIFALAVGPGTLFHFYLARTDTDYKTFLTVVGYVGLGPYLTIPAAIVLLFAFLRRRTFWVGVLLAGSLAAALFVTAPRGDRTYLIALVLPLLVIPYLRRQRRPSGPVIAAALLVAIIGMNVFFAIRHKESRTQRGIGETVASAFTHPGPQIKAFATGVDLGEFSVIELEHQAMYHSDTPLKLHPGATAASIAVYPLPRKLVGTKPLSGAEYVANYLFPKPAGSRRASFSPSMFGDLFADWGWVTLVLISAFIGLGLRTLWEYFRLYRSNDGMQMFFAAMLPLCVILIRNNLTDAIARSVFLTVPLFLCMIYASRRGVPGLRSAGSRGNGRR